MTKSTAIRNQLLTSANDTSLSLGERQKFFERIFTETFTLDDNKSGQFYSLSEDFSETDLAFLKTLSEKDYMQELCYPDWVTNNPFHSIGVPAGLKARRRWLELDKDDGILTTRITVKVNGQNTNWTLWRHLLSFVDKDGDSVPKDQLAFVEKHCDSLALLKILCDDIGFNAYDLRMIQAVQDFAITKATALAKKPTPELLDWAKKILENLSVLNDEQLTSWQDTCDVAYLLAPLAKKLKKGEHLAQSYARLLTFNSRNEKLNALVFSAFSDESKAVVLRQMLSQPIEANQHFFDPAHGFASILGKINYQFTYLNEDEWFFNNVPCILEMAKFCQIAFTADKNAYDFYFLPSGIPQFLQGFSKTTKENAKLLAPYNDMLSNKKNVQPKGLIYYYQAWHTRHLDRLSIKKIDAITQQQLCVMAKKLFGYQSVDKLFAHFENPDHRRLFYKTEVGLLTGATFYDLIITKENGWRKECAVFKKGTNEWLPIGINGEDITALEDKQALKIIAKACDEGLLNVSPEDELNVSWEKYWDAFDKT